MKANRPTVLSFIYRDEGGFVIRDTEPGGAGNWGISFERFEAWWALQHRSGKPTFADLKAMPRSEADALYGKFFMDPCHFDDLPSGVDYVVLDPWINGGGLHTVNTGLGFKDESRPFDPSTLWALTHHPAVELIQKITDARLARNKELRVYREPTKPGGSTTFGQVLDKRTKLVHDRALQIMTGSAKP